MGYNGLPISLRVQKQGASDEWGETNEERLGSEATRA